MPRILISYRRADSDAIAGRIRDQLASRYGSDSVFMDIDSVPVGVDFREQIKNEIDKDDVVLAVIGQRWRGPRKGGRARINDADDPIRVELETALGRPIPIVPVLVNGMRMPKPEQLPESLKKLSFHNAAVVDAGQDFHQHVDRLVRSLNHLLGVEEKAESKPGIGRSKLQKFTAIGMSSVIALMLAWVGWFYYPQIRGLVFTSSPNSEIIYNARADIILQNIVRARYNQEINFGSIFGPGSSSKISQQDWTLSILKPIDLATLNFFIRQNYSRELLFWT